MPKLMECVPNFSEGRRPEIVTAIVSAMQAVPAVRVLDFSSDADHNRSVVTLVGEPDALVEAAFRGAEAASRLIDLTQHRGNHPRMGATDVVPFVPVRDCTMDDAVAAARRLGERLGSELSIPVYLYESAATRPERRNLADVRRGEFEGLREEIGRPERQPDFGPACVHPSAGATAVGARPFLVAFNVNLGTKDVAVAKRIARAVRGSSGGFVNCKALGLYLEAEGVCQVSMNMTDFTHTSLHHVFEFVRREAEHQGVPVVGSEIVGLVPEAALLAAARYYLRLWTFDEAQILERRLADD
ncbi:MAG: glutamate formimidoyltransferase [Bacillota bacterium]